MLVYFVNIAVISAVMYYFARSLKKVFQKEVDHFISWFKDSRRAPPGPYGLPFVGYIPFMAGKNPYTTFSELAEYYGGMAFIKLGQKNILVLRDPEMIKETYKTVAFSDRPNSKLKDDSLIGNKGIIQAVGDVWSEHRRILLSAFRTIGLKSASTGPSQTSTSHCGDIIQSDVEEYIKYIEEYVINSKNSSSFQRSLMLERLTGRFTGSCISSCIFGLKKSFGDKDFAENVEIIEEGFHVGEMIAPFEFLPVLRKIPGWWKKVEAKMKKNHCFTCKYFRGLINEKTCEMKTDKEGLIGIYQEEMAKRSEPQILSEPQLMQTMTDLFCAGTETVKYSLMWAMMYMVKYPEIQEAVQKEIDSIYPKENTLGHYDDIGKMPLTEATLFEALRLRPVLPMGHARATHNSPTEFRGYEIPPNTVVLSLIWDIHQDPQYWQEPEKFLPKRFISTEGKTFKPENFLPFGTGRRLCIGDQMAMMELFISFVSLLKRYSFVSAEGTDIDMSWKIMLSLLIPKNFSVELRPRNAAC